VSLRTSRTLRKALNFLDGWTQAAAVRQPSTAGLRSVLTASQRAELYRLAESPGYQVLLDVMEMACVEQDTQLVNADPADPASVLAKHRMSKAFWQIFVAIQKKVEYEKGEYLGLQREKSQAVEQDEVEQDTEVLM
jgi:hypothetical protein